jgi:glutamate racemase
MTASDPKTASIGIFDSGFGGLTVMRAIRELMPHENIIYFGDTARLPYGSKSAPTILRYSLENASFLAEQGVKVLVVACNTSCSAALEQVRSETTLPVIGITEQGVEEVTGLFSEGKVGILATRATIQSGIYQQQILAKCPAIELFPISCPLFVPLVEEGYVEHPMCTLVVQEYLQLLKNKEIKGLLLGCTHYPLLQSVIQQELGADIQLIDPAIACAKKTRQLLAEHDLLTTSTSLPHYQFFVSDDPEKFRLHGKAFLNYPIEHVSQKCH